MTHIRKGQHFTKLTVSSARWCNKCRKMTQHRVDGGRPGGPCIDCMERKAESLKGGAHESSISGQLPEKQTDLRAAGNGGAFLVWPMACFCSAHEFPHHHPDGFVNACYPGPLVVAEFEAKHKLLPIAEMQKLVASSQKPGAPA